MTMTLASRSPYARRTWGGSTRPRSWSLRQHRLLSSVICLEPLARGHVLHADCWLNNCAAHANDFWLSGGERGQTGARCPLCRGWHGCETAAAAPAVRWMLNRLLGFVYQRRWNAAGRDPSAVEELQWILARIVAAGDVGRTTLETFDRVMRVFRAYSAKHATPEVGVLLTPSVSSSFLTSLTALFHVFVRTDPDDAYYRHFGEFVRTLGAFNTY